MEQGLVFPAVMNPRPKMIVIECVEPRCGIAFEGFREAVGFDRSRGDLLKKLAGGPVAIAHPSHMPDRAKWLRKQLLFDCDHFPSIEMIVAIMHEDCKYYNAMPEQCHRPGKERSDLPFIGGFLRHHFPQKTILLPYARFISRGTKVAFDYMSVPEPSGCAKTADQLQFS